MDCLEIGKGTTRLWMEIACGTHSPGDPARDLDTGSRLGILVLARRCPEAEAVLGDRTRGSYPGIVPRDPRTGSHQGIWGPTRHQGISHPGAALWSSREVLGWLRPFRRRPVRMHLVGGGRRRSRGQNFGGSSAGGQQPFERSTFATPPWPRP